MQYKIPMKYFMLFTTCFFAQHAFSQELITDRPYLTESPYIVPQNHLQFEHGFSYNWGTMQNSFDPLLDINYSVMQIASTLVRYSVNELVELRCEFKPTVATTAGASITGLPPIGLGIKTKIINGDGAIPQVAILTTAYPGLLATENMQPEAPQFAYRLVANHILTNWLSIGWNFGAIVSNINAPLYIYSMSAGFALSDKTACFVEAYGNFSSEPYVVSGSDKLMFDAGFTYGFTPLLQADVSFGFEAGKNNAFYTCGIGISYLLSLKKSNG